MGMVKIGETVEVRREKKPLPAMFFLLAFGTKRFLTRQIISNLSRLPAFEEHTVGTILNRKA